MDTSKCIYCLNEKPCSEFNREHVISRFMGTYENTYVLGNHQVCKECNSYFCDNIENIVSFDSLEGLLRIEHRQTPIHTDRAIGRTRLKIKGQNDIFDGLTMYASSNSGNPNNLKIEIEPAVGIILDNAVRKYEYYSIDDIPVCSDEIKERLKNCKQPFVTFGYEETIVSAALTQKGYDLSKAKYTGDLALEQITTETSLETSIKCKVDSLLSRLAAKNLFNYLCYAYGKEYVLQPCFNDFRDFIRNNHHSEPIKMFLSNGGLKNIPGLVEGCHIVGTGWSIINDQIYLCGFVSWFNSITYTFALFPIPTAIINCLPQLKLMICDNYQRTITDSEYLTVFDWPGDNKKFGFLDENLRQISCEESDG